MTWLKSALYFLCFIKIKIEPSSKHHYTVRFWHSRYFLSQIQQTFIVILTKTPGRYIAERHFVVTGFRRVQNNKVREQFYWGMVLSCWCFQAQELTRHCMPLFSDWGTIQRYVHCRGVENSTSSPKRYCLRDAKFFWKRKNKSIGEKAPVKDTHASSSSRGW